jgi:hypothetical protein
MPPVAAAREAWGREINRIRSKIASGEAELSGPDAFAFHGNTNPYLADLQRGRQAMRESVSGEVARLRAELDELEAMPDAEVASWAVRTDHVRPRHSGGWLIV